MQSTKNFIQDLANKCYSQFGDKSDVLTIIFPNKRAGVYFADYLAKLYSQPIWSPNIYSLDEYVSEQQDKTLADDLQMVFMLYQAYKTIVKAPESFDAFYPWGEMILKDYNDIDNYLIDPEQIFRVIKSQKELDAAFQYLSEKDQEVIQSFWKGFIPEPSKKQNEFLSTWSILAGLYDQFNLLLSKRNLTYKGKMFKDFSQTEFIQPKGAIWFAGFNALTGAEEKIIKKYLDFDHSDIFWEVDDYYLRDPNQESGAFFRQYAKDKYFAKSIERDRLQSIKSSKIKVNIVTAPFSMGQVKAAAQSLSQALTSQSDLSDTLVILPDESMLPSLLHALPPALTSVNVTMGWPIGHARCFILISKIIAFHGKNQTSENIYYPDIKGLLVYKDLLKISEEDITSFDHHALENNTIYHSLEDIEKWFPTLAPLIKPTSNSTELLDALIRFITEMDLDSIPVLEKSAAILLHSTLKRLETSVADHGIELEAKSLSKLLLKLGGGIKIPLSGDPKGGIQIMGILETRNLSFKHVYIIGMNEGAWPKDSANTSFIPFNIRKAFELPTTLHQDAMQSYLFYRLLHRAETLWISYNNISSFNHNGELSRYLQQLQYETNLDISTQHLVNPVVAETEPAITIYKDDVILQALQKFVVKGDQEQKRMSPSALNTYIDCSLKFYFQQIAKIREPKELMEDIDPSLFGNLLHRTMELLYENLTVIDLSTLEACEQKLAQSIRDSFAEYQIAIEQHNTHSGRQLIAVEVIKKYVEKILAFDKKHAPFEIVGLEQNLSVDFPIKVKNQTLNIGLRGIIDRIDQYKSSIRILDYKSGRDTKEFTDFESLLDGTSLARNKAVFQLFYYCMLFKENNPKTKHPIVPGMFNSRELFDPKFDTKIVRKENRKKYEVTDYKEYKDDFNSILEDLLSDIFNPEIAFTQTTEEKKCEYCAYKEICKRG